MFETTEELQALLYMLGKELEAKSCKVFILMLGMADRATGKVDTSLSDLHKRSGMAVTTIRRAIGELEAVGVLEITYNRGTSTDYRLILSGALQEKAFQMYKELNEMAQELDQ